MTYDNHLLKEIPYEPYMKKALRLRNPDLFGEEEVKSNLSYSPEYPFINKIFNLEKQIHYLQKDNEIFNNDNINPEQQEGNNENNSKIIYPNKIIINDKNNPNQSDLRKIKRNYDKIQSKLDKKRKEMELQQQLNYEYLTHQLSPNKKKNKLSYYNQIERLNEMNEKLMYEQYMDKIKQKRENRKIINLLADIISEEKKDIKIRLSSSLPLIKNKINFNPDLRYNDDEYEKRRLYLEQRNNYYLDRIISIQKHNDEVKRNNNRILQDQILHQNNLMRKILMDNARYMMKIPQRRVLRRRQRRIIEEKSEYESDDSNESYEESEIVKKNKKKKKN